MLRATVLSMLIFCSIAAMLPLTEPLAAWAAHAAVSGQQHHGRYRRHSRAWWRRRRARLQRRRELATAARRRQHARAALSVAPAAGEAASVPSGLPQLTSPLAGAYSAAGSPAAFKASAATITARPQASALFPASWNAVPGGAAGERRFSVRAADGRATGLAVLTRVPAMSANAVNLRGKSFGGVPVAALRRLVIDRMVAEGGWVVNDVERRVGDQRVFVVLAQSGAADGTSRRAWNFYFIESGGALYSLATAALSTDADDLASQSEQVINAFAARGANAVVAQSVR